MIDKFSVLYVGQIELDNIGLEGTPADERRYPNERLTEGLANSERLAVLLDELGFYAMWTAEHHFQREGYECLPNLILLGTHLAGKTKNLKFGCAFNIAPMWHPLRLAEDYAMADFLTGGRIIFGVGRGYHSREVETFGAPVIDNDANRELFEEQMEIIFKAFNEESFSHKGKHYQLPAQVPYRGYDLKDITLVPRPSHQPVEIWQPIASGKTLEWMASKGIKAMVGLTGEKLSRPALSATIKATPQSMVATWPWARTWPSTWASTWPTRRRRRWSRCAPPTTSVTNGSLPSALCVIPTNRAALGAHQARRRACRTSRTG